MAYKVRLTDSERKSAQNMADLTRICSIPAAGDRGYGDSPRESSETIEQEASQTETTEKLTRKIEARDRLRRLYRENESMGCLLRLYYRLIHRI